MFGIDPKMIAQVSAKADEFLVELRRLNDNLEALRRDREAGKGSGA